MENGLETKITQLAELFIESEMTIILSGAGMSTESGIPDFRSPDQGLWTKYKPEITSNIDAFMKDPKKFWSMAKEIAPSLFKAKPNEGHKALAELEDLGYIYATITQNIDGLHQQAGSKLIFEVHGNIKEYTCLFCNATYSIKDVKKKIRWGRQLPPLCDWDNVPLKPNVVLFGEDLDRGLVYHAIDLAKKADLLVVVGSSLMVAPVSDFPKYTMKEGGKVAIVNLEPTYLDDKAALVIRKQVGTVLPRLLQKIREIDPKLEK